MVQTAYIKENYSLLKNRTLLALQEVRGEGTREKIKAIDKKIFDQIKPQSYSGRKGWEVEQKSNFEDACLMLKQLNISANPKLLTTFEFYKAWERAKEQMKPRRNARA